MTQPTTGFKVDPDGNLTVDIYNPFWTPTDTTVIIGDEDYTEAVDISQLSDGEGSEVL